MSACIHCGASIGPDDYLHCGRCEARIVYFESICPAIYREVDARLIPRPELFERVVKHWQDGDSDDPEPGAWGFDKPGLLLQGAPRRGKTLTAYALLRRLALRGERPLAFAAVKWARQVVEFSRSGELGEWMDEVCGSRSAILLDDLDKARFTPRVTECLYEVLESFAGNQRAVIVTTNANAPRLLAKLGDDLGPAILGRLVDFCHIVKFE